MHAQGSQRANGKEGLQLACDLGGCQLSAQFGLVSYQVRAWLQMQISQVHAYPRATGPQPTSRVSYNAFHM